MSAQSITESFRTLEREEKIRLLLELWDEVAEESGGLPLGESHRKLLDALFTTLDALEERLARRRFLLGSQFTEADVRLFPTLARFDAVYYLLYKCNLHRLADYRHLWDYARDLYQRPGFGDTTDFFQIKRHYYQTQVWINPTGIVPKGPYVSWLEPHGRDRMAG